MGGTIKDVELQNFFIFNSSYGPKEGEELQKILYYYPITDNTDVQIKNVGLVQGIIQFTETFKPNSSVSSLHTSKIRQLYFQPELNFWVVMTITLPVVTRVKENTSSIEYLEEDVQDNVYEAVLKQAYDMYRLFWGTFRYTLEEYDIGTLKTRIQVFFNAYLRTLKLSYSDILNIFGGLQYLPLDRHTFLKVQCFVNLLESSWDCVKYSAFLYNEHVIWSGIDPSDMQIIYQYLIGTLLPANVETELQGGSMPRNSPSPFAALRYGRFITGPTNLKQAKTVGKVPKVYLFSSGIAEEYHFVVYRALSATVCLFVKAEMELTLDFFKSLDAFINPRLTSIVTGIAEYCSRQVVTPSNIPETSPRFIYFNKMNLAYKSTVHLDNKQTGNIACSRDSLKLMADIKDKNHLLGHAGETIVKTMNDYWVVGKTSNLKEFYIVLQQKNASLIEISGKFESSVSRMGVPHIYFLMGLAAQDTKTQLIGEEEIKKLCDNELKGIFFHPM